MVDVGLVRGLPTLQSLQLGNYYLVSSEDEILEQWGTSLRWEGWVEDRVRQQARRERENERREKQREIRDTHLSNICRTKQ